MEPELTNERAKREWQWLCEEIGENRARAAIGKLRKKGTQRPYPLNIARIEGVKLPPEEDLPPLQQRPNKERVEAELEKMRRAINAFR